MNERLNSFYRELKDKKVSFIGLGRSHRELLGMFAAKGAQVSLRDKRTREQIGEEADRLEAMGIRLLLGENYLEGLCSEDLLLRTPGMYYFHPALQQARQAGVAVTSEMELFFDLCPCKIYAVTGSDGKTTTSSIIAELLKAAGKTVHLGGNIGKPLLCEIPSFGPDDIAVLELSSFQLHSIDIRPNVAVVTNVSPNHLDKHPDFDDYVNAKRQIFANQTAEDVLVVNSDNAFTARFGEEAHSRVLRFSRKETLKNGVFCRNGMIYRSRGYEVESIIPASEILLPGVHNVENYMAAFAAVDEIVSPELCRAVARSYGGVTHRLELIRKLGGVSYINDSIATSPTRTIAGLRAMRAKPILIAGGHDKHVSFDGLADEICERVRALFLTGDTAEQIAIAVRRSVFYDPMRLPIKIVPDLTTAVLSAREMAVPGDIVLLSPACSSFDRFRNFAERGDKFREIVMGFKDDEAE